MVLLLSSTILLVCISLSLTSQPLSPYEYVKALSPQQIANTEYRQLELNSNTRLRSSSDLLASEEKISETTEVTLKQAISIVEKRRLTECVARCICELSCNPNSYGPKGRSVYRTLKPFESDTLPQLAFYKEASNRGKNVSPKCNECYIFYTNCKTSTDNILRLASALTIKT